MYQSQAHPLDDRSQISTEGDTRGWGLDFRSGRWESTWSTFRAMSLFLTTAFLFRMIYKRIEEACNILAQTSGTGEEGVLD